MRKTEREMLREKETNTEMHYHKNKYIIIIVMEVVKQIHRQSNYDLREPAKRQNLISFYLLRHKLYNIDEG